MRRRGLGTTAIVAIIVMMVLLLTTAWVVVRQFQQSDLSSKLVVRYGNDIVNEDSNDRNNFNFGPNRDPKVEARDKSEYATSEEYLKFDFFRSMTPVYEVVNDDGEVVGYETYEYGTSGPVLVEMTLEEAETYGVFDDEVVISDHSLAAAVALHLDNTLTGGAPKLLGPEAKLLIGQRADEASRRFYLNHEEWVDVVWQIHQLFSEGSYAYKNISGSYQSQMYMHNDAEENGGLGAPSHAPSIIVRGTNGVDGKAFYVNTKFGEVSFRTTCGYQPYHVAKYWPTPKFDFDVTDDPTPPPSPNPTPWFDIIVNDPVPVTYTLTLNKVITGDYGSGNAGTWFDFEYTFSENVTVNGVTNRTGTVSLQGGQSAIFSGIPNGTTYSIVEKAHEAWNDGGVKQVSGTVTRNTSETVTNLYTPRKDPAFDPVRQGNAPVGGGVNHDPGPGVWQPVEPPKPAVIQFSGVDLSFTSVTVDFGTSVGSIPLPTATYRAVTGEAGRAQVSISDSGAYDGGASGVYAVTLQIVNANNIDWVTEGIVHRTITVTVGPRPQQQQSQQQQSVVQQPVYEDNATPPPTLPIPVVSDSHDPIDTDGDGYGDSGAGNENGSFTPPD